MFKKTFKILIPMLGLVVIPKAHALFANFVPFKKLSLGKKGPQNLTKNALEHSLKCQDLLVHFEKKYHIPSHLLRSIAAIESKSMPWAVYARGRSHFFKNKEAALKFVKQLEAQNVQVINIGCMQIDVKSHKRAFGSIDKILMPYHNIEFAAKLLKRLHQRYGSWSEAVRYYHSSSSVHNISYKDRVLSKVAKAHGKHHAHGGIHADPEWLRSPKLTVGY